MLVTSLFPPHHHCDILILKEICVVQSNLKLLHSSRPRFFSTESCLHIFSMLSIGAYFTN